MDVRLLASLVLAFAASGCSFYDVATNAADAVAGTGLISDKDPNDTEWNGLWNPETSQCRDLPRRAFHVRPSRPKLAS